MSDLNRPLSGRVWLFGDSISTNQIGGGGRGQRGMAPEERLALMKANCLVSVRPEFSQEVESGEILVAGMNFGNGSSSPGAVEALIACGIGAVVAESISRLLLRTCIAKGLPAFAAPGVLNITGDREELVIDYAGGFVSNPATGQKVALRRYPPTVEQIYEAGGIQNVIARRLEAEGIRPAASKASVTS